MPLPFIAVAAIITAGIIGTMTASRVLDLALPGNEALLKKAMMKLKFKKDSAEAQFLKSLTLEEVQAQADDLRQTIQKDTTGTNMLLHSISSQNTAYDQDLSGQNALHHVNEAPTQSVDSTGLRGNRQDVEGMHAALASLTQKTKPGTPTPRIPANLRLTGRPTNG